MSATEHTANAGWYRSPLAGIAASIAIVALIVAILVALDINRELLVVLRWVEAQGIWAALLFTAGYIAIGVPAAILVGIGVGALSIVPYLSLVGIPVAIMLMQLDPPGGFRENWWWILAAPTLWYMIVQAIDDYVLTPKIQGDATDMDTPTVLFSALAGGILFGFFGVLVAIPIAACIKILIVELLMPRLRAWAEGDAQDPLPISEEAH